MQSANGNIEQQAEPQTWETHVVIPLVQNASGGVVVWLVGMAGVIAYTGFVGKDVDFYNAGVWCGLAAILVFGLFTIIRFFGDDLGIVTSAYRIGWHARDAEVNALHMQLHSVRNDMDVEQAEGSARSAIDKRQLSDNKQLAAASKIIQVHFDNMPVSREQMNKYHKMGQTDWEAGMRLLKAAGVANSAEDFVATNSGLALRAIKETMQADRAKGDTFVPRWQ